MRTILAAVAALALALPAASFARDHGRGGEHGGPQAQAQPHERHGGQRAGGFQRSGNFAQRQNRPQNFGSGQHFTARNFGGDRRQFAQQNFQGRTFGGRNFAENRDRGRGFEGRTFGGRTFAYRGRTYAAFSGGPFRYPRGYSYRHWYRGQYLPSIFLAPEFFIDWNYLGLPPPPAGAEWVRYGPDALLVDDYTGQVIDVIYNAFY